MAQRKNAHIGGEQVPMFPPASNWRTPARLPTPPRSGVIALDVETKDDGLKAGLGPGWALGMGYIAGVAMAWEGVRCYAPIRHPDSDNLDKSAVRSWVAAAYDGGARIVCHNASYDLGWVHADLGLAPPRGQRIHDTMLAAFHVDENTASLSLDALCAAHGLPGKDETLLREAATAYGFDAKAELWRLPARYVGGYAEQDVGATLALLQPLLAILEAEGTRDAYEVDAELIACVVEMRRRGVPVDTLNVELGRDNLKARCDVVLADLSHRAGRTVTIEDVRSWQKMSELCRAEGVEYPSTAKGQPSFKAEWMQGNAHWLPRLAEQADRLTNAADKFLGNFILNYAHKGRIHATVNQFLNESDNGRRSGTRSHRFSYSDPALQQAPGGRMESIDDIGAFIVETFRGGLLPEPGEIWSAIDYSQQEFRLLVHLGGLLKLRAADIAVRQYNEDPDTDFHDFVVEITQLPRKRAKSINFSKAFGSGLKTFAAQSGLSLDDAAAAMSRYDEELPFVKESARICDQLAQQRGYIRLIDNARIHYSLYEPGAFDLSAEQMAAAKAYGGTAVRWSKGRPRAPLADAKKIWPGERLRRADTRKGLNNYTQGSGARMTKSAMLTLWREGIVPSLTLHDELGTSVGSEATVNRIAQIMREAAVLTVPLKVDVECGISWGTAQVVKNAQKQVLYGATYSEARRLQTEGRWW